MDIAVIPISGKHSDKVAIVDADMSEALRKYKWTLCWARGSRTLYARATIRRKTVMMHRLVIACPAGLEVDHINGVGLDNRRANLRTVTHAQNIQAARDRLGDEWRTPPPPHGARGVHKVTSKGKTYWYAYRGGPRIADPSESPKPK